MLLCWHNFKALHFKELWFHTRTGKRKRFTPVHNVMRKRNETCDLLPALHVSTGCDSTSSLHGIGMKKALSVLKKNSGLLQGLTQLGNDCVTLDQSTVNASMKYIGLLKYQ